MTQYTPQDLFTDSQIYDLIDLVKGGSGGDANIPLKALADRTQYLFNRQGLIEVKRLTGSYTYDENDAGKAFAFHISSNSAFNLPDVSTLPAGAVIRISTRIPVIKALTINCSGSQKIYDGSADLSVMYMHDAERLWLSAAALDNGDAPDHWEILDSDGNFFTAGQSFGVRKVLRNSIINNGIIYNRADTPRLWSWASGLGSGLVSDAVWLSDPGGLPVYRGLYSTGNGSTTFRGPDERAMSDRYLDIGRGIDTSRLSSAPGGYEKDQLLSHTHKLSKTGDKFNDSAPTWAVPNAFGDYENQDTDFYLKAVGGPENLVKNIGKIPVTLY
jgi:hypothetical protein